MARLTHISLAKAAHRYTQTEICDFMAKIYPAEFQNKFNIAEVFQNSLVDERSFILPFEKILSLGNAVERNRLYLEKGVELAKAAIAACLAESALSADEIDTLIFVSSTGFAVPSLETYWMDDLGFSPSLQRIPVVGWGCTGGVAGLQTALKFAQADAQSKILLVNLETCSLAFQAQDHSPKSVVANAIFNDACTASLIMGRNVELPLAHSMNLLERHSRLFPNSSHLMGWKQLDSGLEVILSPEIPSLARNESRSFVNELLEKSSFSLGEIKLWMLHPGGAKILQALQQALELSPEAMQVSWDNLKRNGNMSSCSILAGLKTILEDASSKGYGLACAFGPGFACEGLLFSK